MENIIYGDQLLDAAAVSEHQQIQHIQLTNEPLQAVNTIKLEGSQTGINQQNHQQQQQFITFHIGSQGQVIQALNSNQEIYLTSEDAHGIISPAEVIQQQAPVELEQPSHHDIITTAEVIQHQQQQTSEEQDHHDAISAAETIQLKSEEEHHHHLINSAANVMHQQPMEEQPDHGIITQVEAIQQHVLQQEEMNIDEGMGQQQQQHMQSNNEISGEQNIVEQNEQITAATSEAANLYNNSEKSLPSESDMAELQFQAQLKKLEQTEPQFVMGPPSMNSGDEDEMDTSLIRGVVKGNGVAEEEEEILNDQTPQFEFKNLFNKEQAQPEEDAFSDEGIVKDQVVITRGDKKIVVRPKKHSIISSTDRKVRTKMPPEDPQLLMDLHEQYNQLCIFCHSNHSQKCLLYDPMEKYEDIDQVGPPYTYGMPDQILMGLSRVYEGTYSLFARDDIPAFTQFGPLKGRIVEESEFKKISLLEIDIENFWPIEASEHDELMIDHWLDTSDVEISNWLKFILPESPKQNTPSYNVQRITKDGEIFFVTTEHILSGEELFMRSMEPPYRVYHNLKEMKRTEFLCGLMHTYRSQGNQTINLENMVYYVRHHVFVHSIQPGVFSTAYIFNCPVCGEDCYTKAHRLDHMNENHKDAENIKTILKRDRRCYYCKKSFTTQAMLGYHIKYNHPNDEEVAAGYECPVCKTRMKTKPSLRKHMQESHLPINVGCEICGKVMKNKGTLKVHMMKIHAKKGLKQCSLCDKQFGDLYQLRVHSLTHNKLRPFDCQADSCDQSFTTKQCLQKHYKIKHGMEERNMPEIVRTIDVKDMPVY